MITERGNVAIGKISQIITNYVKNTESILAIAKDVLKFYESSDTYLLDIIIKNDRGSRAHEALAQIEAMEKE